MTERSTYFIDGVCQKSYLCNFVFMSETKWQKELTKLNIRLQELEQLKTIEVVVEWKVIKDQPYLTER